MGPLLWFLCLLHGVTATHFAYGTMNWVSKGQNANGQTQVRIFQNYAWRRNFYLQNAPPFTPRTDCPELYDPDIGGCPLEIRNLNLGWSIRARALNSRTTVGTVMVSATIDKFYTMQESTDLLALAPKSDVNWIRGFYIYDWVVADDNTEYVVIFDSNARLSTLLDGNNDKSWVITCNIKIFDSFVRSRGPSTTGSIREYLESCVESGFTVPRIISDGRALSIYASGTGGSGSTVLNVAVAGEPNVFVARSSLSVALPSIRCANANPTVVTKDGKLTWFPLAPNQGLCSAQTTNENCQNRYTAGNVGCFWDKYRNICEKKDEFAVQFTLVESSASLYTTYDVIFEVSRFCAQTDTTCNHAPHFSPRFAGPYYGTPNTPSDATYHKTICLNPNATSCQILRGVEKILSLNVVDYDVSDTVTASSSLLPFAMSLSPPAFRGQVRDIYEANIVKSTTVYTLKWIPPLDAIDAVVCFQALDSQGKPSNGNYCLTFVILEAEYIYVSGIVRDFMTNHTDFARSEVSADDIESGTAQWIANGLSNGKPVRNGAAALGTVTKFDQWFNTIPGVNMQTVFSTTLVKLGTEDRFTYSNTNFLPINGILFGNDKTQGSGFSTRDYNSFFTYEMHTYLVFNASTNVNYTYGSTDDMWLFINGILVPGLDLHGIHPARTRTIDLKKLYSQLNFNAETTLYKVDLFYADRSKSRTEPMIRMELPKAVLCDALSSGVLEMQFRFNGTYSALAGTDLYIIGAAERSTAGLVLLTQSQTASAVFMADSATKLPKPLKVLQGFEATFDFQINGLAQGFAFVISSQDAVGSAGNQLGYGGIQKILAVEFDTFFDSTNGEPAYNHVAVMAPAYNASTGFSDLAFTSNHQYALASSIYSPSNPEFGPQLTMTNNSVHHVRITYAPPQQGDTSRFKTGWLRVWIGAVIKPVVEVPIPAIFLADMLGSAARVGFTSGAGTEATSKILIKNFQIIVVPPSPTNTIVLSFPGQVVAGVVTTVRIQSRDSCGNNILVGADQARYAAQIRVFSSNRLLTTEVTTSFTTNNDGTYNFIFSCTRAGQYVVTLTFDGVEIVGSGVRLIVAPAVISRTRSQFVFGSLLVADDNSLNNLPGLYMIAVRANDGAILSQVQNNDATSILNWLNSFSAGTIFGVVNIGAFISSSPGLVSKFNNLGCRSFSTLVTSQASWACISNGTGTEAFRVLEPVDQISRNFGRFMVVAQSDTTQQSGYLNVVQTAETTLTFFASTNSTLTTVTVIAMDQYGNLARSQNDKLALSFSPVMTNGNSNLDVVPQAPGYYSATLSTTSASTYTMTILLVAETAGGNLASTPATLTFLAGPASYLTTTASGIGLSNSQAGIQTQFSVQLIDAFGNQIRDAFNAQTNSIVVYFQSVNSQVIVNCSQAFSSAASELQVTYTPLVLGTYNLVLVINGKASALLAGRQMLVVPGAVSPSSCTYSDIDENTARTRNSSASLTNAAAGVQKCVWVQSRDRFGNARNSPSDVFTFKLIGRVRDVINSSYAGGGIFVHCFYPTIAPAQITVAISFNNIFVGTPALNQVISVSVGNPSTLSYLSKTTINVTAGIPELLSVACFDSENNTISTCDPSAFSFTLFTLSGIPSNLGAIAGPVNFVRINTTANIAGQYTIQARANAQQISNSPASLTVIPGVTDGTKNGKSTPPSGVGAFGGTRESETTLFIQAADFFGNTQVHWKDVIIVKINNGNGITAKPVSTQPGLWTVNYTVPLTSPFYISYTINDVLSYNASAFGSLNGDKCRLSWNSSNISYMVKAGTTLNLYIPYELDSAVVTNNSIFFKNDSSVNSTIFQVLLSNITVAPQIEFTTTVNASSLYPYQGSYSGLQKVGVYTLSASANRVVPCTPNFFVTVVPGDIDSAATQFFNVPTECIAGSNYSFQVLLRDRFGQNISDSQNILNLTLADVLGQNPLDFTSTYNPSTSMYNFSFVARVAGSYNAVVNLTSPYSLVRLGQPPYISVVPGDPYAPNSVANPPSIQAAGTQVSFYVSLYDNAGNSSSTSNLAAGFDQAKWTLDVKVGGQTPSGLQVNPSPIDGRFYVTYTPLVSGTNVMINLALRNNNVTTGNIPVPLVRIDAGAVSVPPSNVTQGGNTTAGDVASIIFSAFDINNNPVLGAALSSYVTSEDGVKFPQFVEIGNGKYNISLSGSDTQRSGIYNWVIQVNSQVINVPLAPLVVVPGPVDWKQLVIPGLTGASVGSTAEIVVQLKDQYGNNVTTSSPTGVQVVIQQPGVFCQALSGESKINLTDVTSSISNLAITSLPAGRLQVAFTPLFRGLFRLALLLNQKEPPCQDNAVFAVSAGPVSAPRSDLTITTNTTADISSIKTARIVFLDAYGNNVDDYTCRFLGNIYFGNHSYGNPVVSPAADWLAPTFSETCQLENGYFVYYITFQASKAGNFSSVLVLGEAGKFEVISSQKPLIVAPGIAVAFSAPTDSTGKLLGNALAPRATRNAQFDLTATDAQDNLIVQTSTHYFEVVCRLAGTRGDIVYSFQPNITSNLGFHRATFTSNWAGLFQCEAKLYRAPAVYVSSRQFALQINPAVCPQFQCSDGTCVDAYSACPVPPKCSDPARAVQCADGSCQATSLECPCPSGTVRCSDFGYCVASLTQCPPPTSCAVSRCPTGECPTKDVPCPSLTVCTPGFTMCSDTLTCVLNVSLCPSPPGCTGTQKYACAQGNCVSALSDCPDRLTCPADRVLCFDGTCALSSAVCPSTYDCPVNASFRCSDASCVPRQADCPSQTSCPTGFVKCWNRVCASSLALCDPVNACPSGTLRCSTGDCAVNIHMCPSQQSCPSATPVMCPDGACVTSVTSCSLTFGCPPNFLTCPSGSCIQSASTACPTQTKCAAETPVLCTDGSCVNSTSACTTSSVCPVASPVRCPDGSCRGSVVNCPTMVVCPTERPISCADGYCAADISQCVSSSQLTCPPPLVRCFYGECVSYLNACPPHTTCPLGYDRCSDGTCRAICSAVIPVGQCALGKIQCPQSSIGRSCADKLELCPPGIVCPVSTPTRCFDGSCADSLANCVQGSTISNIPVYASDTKSDANEIPCPDGTWSPDGLCGTPIFCPLGQFLCSNYQCLTVQTDCPVSPTCASSSKGDALKPLLCGTVCVAAFSSNDCTRASTACSAATPFRCADGVCRADPKLCVASAVAASSRCAPLDLCRDGTCSGACPSASAVCAKNSPSTPIACQDGMCTDSLSNCNSVSSGCPPNSTRCSNSGVCRNSLTEACPDVVCPGDGFQAFGFCIKFSEQGQILRNRCPTSLPYRCFDGTCVGVIAECTSPTWDTPSGITPPNTCPFSSPYRCANGYCATASNMCPTIPSDYCDGSTTGQTACADGSCAKSSIFCPVVRPCLATEQRGPDGICRSQTFIETYGNLVVSSCRASYPYRCANGLCAKDSASCLDPSTMCSAQQSTRCENGACVVGDFACKALLVEPNGCNSSAPNKCWNGDCIVDVNLCPTTDMCPGQFNYSRCPKSQKCVANVATDCAGDAEVTCPPSSFSCGSCETDVNQCVTTQGCPLTAPVRCATGSCSKANECSPTVVCDLGQVVCADGSCQFTLLACPPFPSCAQGTSLCSDKTCKANCTQSVCPATSPILCQNGACTSNLKLCPGVVSVELNPGIANANETYTPPCPNPNAPALCFDGRCRTFEGCVEFAKQVNSSTGGNAALLNCASPSTICADGSCATDLPAPARVGIYCPIIPRCPANTYRCGDGSCRTACTMSVPSCPSGTMRCEDGRCRTACLAYDGCGLNTPYHCDNRNCAINPAGCAAQLATLGVAPLTSIGRRLLQINSTSAPTTAAPTAAPTTSTPATWCKTNCISQLKAYQMTVTVDPSSSPQVDLAIDASNNVIASVLIPSGSLLSTSSNAVTIEFRPVADSLMRNAENAVHPTRQTEFGTQMTYAETLLSVAFECVVPTTVVSPFALNLTYSATIDFTRRPTTQYLTNSNSGPDVCLAYLYRIPALRYSRWTCFPDGVVPRHASPPNQLPPGVQLNQVEGPISDCGKGPLGKIYGFIHSPLKATNVEVSSQEKTWAEKNVLLVLMIFLLAAIILFLCIYCGFRLQRYRKKYLKEAEAVDKMKDEVEEMEQYGGTAGTKDDEVEMIPNVMVVQLQQLQDTLNVQNKEEKEKELENLRLETEERRKHLEQLRADRDNLATELAQLQSDLHKKQNAPVARPVIEDFSPQETASSAPSSGDTPATVRATPAAKTAFSSVRPTKKKDL